MLPGVAGDNPLPPDVAAAFLLLAKFGSSTAYLMRVIMMSVTISFARYDPVKAACNPQLFVSKSSRGKYVCINSGATNFGLRDKGREATKISYLEVSLGT